MWLVVLLLAVAVACTDDTGEVPPEPTSDEIEESSAAPDEAPEQEPVDDPVEEPESCRADLLDPDPLVRPPGSASELSVALATQTHRCASTVVVAPGDDPWVASVAAAAAVHLEAPLLLLDDRGPSALTGTLNDLDAEQILAIDVGGEGLPDPLTSVVGESPDPWSLAIAVAEHLNLEVLIGVPYDDVRGRTAALGRLDGNEGLIPLPESNGELADLASDLPASARLRVLASEEGFASTLSDRLLAVGIDAVAASGSLFRQGTPTSWLVDPEDGQAAAVAAVAARGRGEDLLPITGGDLRSGREDTARLRAAAPDQVVLAGEATDDAPWQLDLVLSGPELPGGGFSLFENRRMVAIYGSPETSVLGAMGEQSLDETIPRLEQMAEPYGADGLEILPAFEMITTIASAAAESTGDYSRRTPIETIRPWVDRAAEEDIYVILDLQPGRTDFLTQAQEYEELLLEPHVGLALDPEWRLGPDEVHLRQIGSVDAAEVQEVADWLANLTRENNLPEKLLVLHQFRFSMLPDRDDIVAPPELAVVVHMDGQGSQSAKDETYAAITAGVEDLWLWGWKNFYDEDEPTATPERVLELEPRPVFVSYQ